jgi:murein DD-endopeptidase MepM/ murein hydrolase activator NlpD
MHTLRTYLRKLLLPTLVGILALTAIGGASLSGGTPAKAVATNYSMPCDNFGISGYGFGQYVSGWGYHVGEDSCGGGAGRAIYAAAEGVVTYSARTPDSYRWGNLVMIEHTNPDGGKVVSLYGHLGNNRQVSAGQTVGRGQLVGFTGPAYTAENGNWASHLHFGVHNGGYGAAIGTYAGWVHGYESSFPAGWISPSLYVRDRMIPVEYGQVSGPSQIDMGYTEQKTVSFQVRNLSGVTWQKDGAANPFRLGTINPFDRQSAFGGGTGWAGKARIKLVADTPNNSIATFTATFAANKVAGSYPECFAVVQEGNRWFYGNPICVQVNVSPPSYRAQWYNQVITRDSNPTALTPTAPIDYLLPGQRVSVKLMYRNSGEYAWDSNGAAPVRLGTSRPNDRQSGFAVIGDTNITTSENWLSMNRASGIDGRYDPTTNTITPTDHINPGEIGVFSFTTSAPQFDGLAPEYFNPVVDGIGWMNDTASWIPFKIMPNGYHYQFVSQVAPAAVGRTTSKVQTSVQLRNTGRTAWPVNGALRLATDRPLDAASPFYSSDGSDPWLAPNRPSAVDRNVTAPGKTTIDPGEVAEFSFEAAVPAVPAGTYKIYARPVMDGVAWLPEDYGMYLPINVTVGPYDYRIEAQTYTSSPGALAVGSQTTGILAVRNRGRASWAVGGKNPVLLGTAKPQDRASKFATMTGTDPWLAPNRASRIDGKVTNLSRMTVTSATEIKPDEIAYFRVPLSANVPNGTYTEAFNLVQEGIGWLPDKNLSIPITVSGSSQPTSGTGTTAWSTSGHLFSSCVVTGTTSASCDTDPANNLVTAAWNYKVTYQTSALASGLYSLKLGYRNTGGSTIPSDYNFKVNLRINGGTIIPIELDGDSTTATIPNLQLPAGTSSISLEWTNDYWVPDTYDANLGLSSIELTK